MKVHQEPIREIERYITKHAGFDLAEMQPAYDRYIEFVEKLKKIKPGMKVLEIGTGMGWFPIMAKMNGIDCKGLEISPQLIAAGMEIGERNGVVPDIELGNIEDTDIGRETYDVIIASSVFEHVEHWRSGLRKVYDALRPGGVLFFESTNKFMLRERSGEYGAVPLYGWLPDAARYRLRRAVHGEDVMKLGIDFNQFRYSLLRRTFRELGFRQIFDMVDLVDLDRLPKHKRTATRICRAFGPAKWLALTFWLPATTFVCGK